MKKETVSKTALLITAFFLATVIFSITVSPLGSHAQSGNPDLNELLKNYGLTVESHQDDLNNDGAINSMDFLEKSRNSVLASCGDGKVNFNEACDDGNTTEGDACSSSCSLESPEKTAIGAKEVFIISDQNWRNVMTLLPVAVWTADDGSININPTLIYHQESGTAFDADSMLTFLKEYTPSKATVIGTPPAELADLLTTPSQMGGGIKAANLSVVGLSKLPTYWKNPSTVVFVEDDYETAMHAAVFASLKNLPLVVENSSIDAPSTYNGKYVLCVGDSIPDEAECKSSYSTQLIKEAYMAETNTRTIVYTNPSDLTIYQRYSLYPRKSSGMLSQLYTRTSLIAPYLAAARHQLLVTGHSTDYQLIDDQIKNAYDEYLGGSYNETYLTVVGAPNAIPYRIQEDPIGSWSNHRSTDMTEFADFDNDLMPDVYTGRIMGISTTDVSTQVARTFLYDEMNHTSNIKFTASSFTYMINQANRWAGNFSDVGYNAISVTQSSGAFDPIEWENQRINMYLDHGSSSYSGIYYSQIPDLPGSEVYSDSCSTCSTYNVSSFCTNAIRKGATSYAGAVSIGWTGNMIYSRTLSGIYHQDKSIGQSFKEGYMTGKYRWMTILLADPVFQPTPQYYLSSDLSYY